MDSSRGTTFLATPKFRYRRYWARKQGRQAWPPIPILHTRRLSIPPIRAGLEVRREKEASAGWKFIKKHQPNFRNGLRRGPLQGCRWIQWNQGCLMVPNEADLWPGPSSQPPRPGRIGFGDRNWGWQAPFSLISGGSFSRLSNKMTSRPEAGS